eukprot:1145361-Pelagomonas_calceolata.AAC.5
MEQNIWQRKTGLLGVWGAMIEKWLDQLLPDNAHELCRNRVTVVVTTLPDWSQVCVKGRGGCARMRTHARTERHGFSEAHMKWSRQVKNSVKSSRSQSAAIMYPAFGCLPSSSALECCHHHWGAAIMYPVFGFLPRSSALDAASLGKPCDVASSS